MRFTKYLRPLMLAGQLSTMAAGIALGGGENKLGGALLLASFWFAGAYMALKLPAIRARALRFSKGSID